MHFSTLDYKQNIFLFINYYCFVTTTANFGLHKCLSLLKRQKWQMLDVQLMIRGKFLCIYLCKSYSLFSLPIKKMKMMSQNVEFFVRLCNDVLLEVLQRGDRRQLAELEKTGRRFYLIIDCCIKEAPLLRLHLSLQPLYLFSLAFKIKNHSRFTALFAFSFSS